MNLKWRVWTSNKPLYEPQILGLIWLSSSFFRPASNLDAYYFVTSFVFLGIDGNDDVIPLGLGKGSPLPADCSEAGQGSGRESHDDLFFNDFRSKRRQSPVVPQINS
ncbi:hypothetical protein CDL15_Pgr013109 [Punica granatum]|uniref:Uncharacterized protein n=1 Tax=Punica granatum TaxID=22663 RepID=A0A218WK78_PUNGR|nr:hypothetical protein CDL15_Pgr013109 [Punica granatum]